MSDDDGLREFERDVILTPDEERLIAADLANEHLAARLAEAEELLQQVLRDSDSPSSLGSAIRVFLGENTDQ